jgi:hypothetical protein
MKCNKWTLGLAAVGVVSLASVASAQTNQLMTAVASTTLSGYVDTSAEWNLGTGNSHAPNYSFGGPGKADGFNLNVVDLNLERDPDATDGWGAGYKVELWMGPDANTLATASSSSTGDLAVKNAYVDLKAPLGNGLDIKIGVWDTIIGYEVADSLNNPNFTRSYGFTVEPTTHTGVLLGYTVNEMISLNAGIANTFGPMINQRANTASGGIDAESYKAYMGSVTFTAPTNMDWFSGSSASFGVINGFNSGTGGSTHASDETSLYGGISMNTPLKELKVGAAIDYVDVGSQPLTSNTKAYQEVYGLYTTYQATDKLSLNARGEYIQQSHVSGLPLPRKALEGTLTAQYDLWKNVLSRVELRWDHQADGGIDGFGGTSNTEEGGGTRKNSYEVIGNVVYKF